MITYDAAVETARMTAVQSYFSNGSIEILTAADAVLVAFGLGAPAGSVSGSVWTLTPFDAGTVAASAAGTAAKAQIKTSGGSAHVTGLTVTATGGGGDITLNTTTIASGQNVTLSSGTITHA